MDKHGIGPFRIEVLERVGPKDGVNKWVPYRGDSCDDKTDLHTGKPLPDKVTYKRLQDAKRYIEERLIEQMDYYFWRIRCSDESAWYPTALRAPLDWLLIAE